MLYESVISKSMLQNVYMKDFHFKQNYNVAYHEYLRIFSFKWRVFHDLFKNKYASNGRNIYFYVHFYDGLFTKKHSLEMFLHSYKKATNLFNFRKYVLLSTCVKKKITQLTSSNFKWNANYCAKNTIYEFQFQMECKLLF